MVELCLHLVRLADTNSVKQARLGRSKLLNFPLVNALEEKNYNLFTV